MKEAEDDSTPESAEAWCDVKDHLRRYGRSGVHPQSARSVLNKLMAKRGYNQQQVSVSLTDLWEAVVPPQWRNQSQVKSYKRGTLEIKVSNPAILQQLEFSKLQLLKTIEQKSPELKIKNLRFSLS